MYISQALLIDVAIAIVTSVVTTLVMIALGYIEHAPMIAMISGLASFSALSVMARLKLEAPEPAPNTTQ